MIKKEYAFGMFILCFLMWVFVVDQAILPGNEDLQQDSGTYSRYRIKKWSQGGKLGFLKDELIIYAVVKGRERFYYMDCMPGFESSLQRLPQGTPVAIRWDSGFPKLWKKKVYDLKTGHRSLLRFSPPQLLERQKEIWKFTGIMGGVFLLLAVLGLINKPGRR